MQITNDMIKYLAATELTINTDAITITQANHKLQPQTGTADNLATINGTSEGQFGVLYVSDFGTDIITIKHNTGNILCLTGQDIIMSYGCLFWYSNGTKVFVVGDGGGSSQPFSDSSALMKNATDQTKLLAFALSGISSGTTRTVTIPNKSGTMAMTSDLKGRVEILTDTTPTTSGVTVSTLNGASTPIEQFTYWSFDNTVKYRDFLCRLIGYKGNGLRLDGKVLRTTANAGEYYSFEASIRRFAYLTDDLTVAHTYYYVGGVVVIPAGPPAAGIPLDLALTWTHGTSMDNLADGEFFYLRLRRTTDGTATDVARVLTGISITEQ